MEGVDPHTDVSAVPVETPVSLHSTYGARSPVPLTPFIGRERQVAEVRALLKSSTVRLLTLTGPGGIGKTRLALSVAGAVRDDFADGVYYVSLASLTDPDLVLPAVAQALGIHEARPVQTAAGYAGAGGVGLRKSPLLERLQDLLAEQQLLLVLDNFEQVSGASAALPALLGSCPGLKVLVTSREVLRLSAEQTYSVPPLGLPDLGNLPPLEQLARTEAVGLFVARAKAAQPDFALTPANAAVIATICSRLDGLPLALELAAARIRLLHPAEMLTRLEGRLSWLTGGPKDAPSRHQTLRAATGWSYDLLTPAEQQLFRQLAVFVGGCTMDAVVAVCYSASGAQHSDAALDTVATLVDKSLLRQEPAPLDAANDPTPRPQSPAADYLTTGNNLSTFRPLNLPTRYVMLETIREYALEQLAGSGEAEGVRRSHALYYVGLAEEAGAGMTGPDQRAWLDRLEQEHDNLRAALTWAAAHDDRRLGARLASSLWVFWLMRGYISEGRRWLDSLLTGDHPLPDALRARALNGASRLALRQGDYPTADTFLQESLALRRSLGDTRGEMEVLDNLGLVAIYRDDLPGAQRYFEQSLAGWRSLGDEQGMTTALNRLGLTLRYRGDFDAAAGFYEECLALARRLHSTYYTAAALHNLGQMEHHRGNDARAHELLVESLLLVRQLGDRPDISVFLADAAGVWAAWGEPERAARLFSASQHLRDNMQVIMYRAQRLAYEQDLARAAAQLDTASWEAAWAKGRGMSLEEAFALAIEDLPTAPTSTSYADPYDLTEREREVLRLLVAGLTYSQIAAQLTVSFHTVHAHLRSIYGKLGVTSRSRATRFAIERLNMETLER